MEASARMRSCPWPRLVSTLTMDHSGQFRASARYVWTCEAGRSMATDLVMDLAGAYSGMEGAPSSAKDVVGESS